MRITSSDSTILIAANRGVHTDFPENSMAAFAKAIGLGIDVIEIDIRRTKDNILVIMHDETVDRTTNGNGRVEEFTFEEIRKLQLTFNGQVTHEKIPTLEEVLTLAKGKILVDLDIKTDVHQVIQAVHKTGTEDTCFIFITRGMDVNMIKEKYPALRTMIRTRSEADVDALFAKTRTEMVHIDDNHNTVTVTSKIKNNGARVWINALGEVDKRAAAGDLQAYGELMKNGANIIQTDYPELLIKYLKSRNLYSRY